ncbi:tripartite tricarboxylate transporter TctB family protein [Acuticoccus sediminis]|nr:tripartite tricarboxylate transporter TctB family protein [Acuticoccus sediminis]
MQFLASLLARALVPLGLAVFAVIYFDQAGKIRSLYNIGPVGPSDYPKLLAVALGLALVAVVVTDASSRRRKDEVRTAPVDWGGLAAAGLVIVASALYVALFRTTGFLISTGLYALALLAIFSRLTLRPVRAIVQAAVLVGLVYFLFGVLFDVRLPESPSVDALLSRIEALVSGPDAAPPAAGTGAASGTPAKGDAR